MQFLRDLQESDRDQLLVWRNLPEVARFMYTEHAITAEEHARWFAGIAGDARRKYWVIQHRGQAVGLANLYDIQPLHGRASFAFYLADAAARGRGIAPLAECELADFAFGELGLEKLACEVLAFNERTIDLHQSLGFVEEGRLRRHIHKSDGWHDVVVLGLLREEWERGREAREGRLGRIRERLTRG